MQLPSLCLQTEEVGLQLLRIVNLGWPKESRALPGIDSVKVMRPWIGISNQILQTSRAMRQNRDGR